MRIVDRSFEDYAIGERRESTGRTITEADVVLHAGQSGDFYPHHMDASWCAKQPFRRRMAHGTLIMSVGVGMMADEINPSAISYGYERVRFVRPVFIGDTITVQATIVAKRDHPKRLGQGLIDEDVVVENDRGEVVLVLTHVYLVERRLDATEERADSPDRDRGPVGDPQTGSSGRSS